MYTLPNKDFLPLQYSDSQSITRPYHRLDDLVQPFQPGPIRRKLHDHASRLRKRLIKRAAFRTYGIKQNACRLTHPHAASARRIRTYGILAVSVTRRTKS